MRPRRTLSILAGTLVLAALASAGSEKSVKDPDGMVWIPGGEFSMGAVVGGRGSGEMAMPSNDAEPIQLVRVAFCSRSRRR